MNEIIRSILFVLAFVVGSLILITVVQLIREGIDALKSRTDNKNALRYLDEIEEAVSQAVQAVNQTYVDALKEKGQFDIYAQKEALERAIATARNLMPKDVYAYAEAAYESVRELLIPLIEAAVREYKE